MLNIAPRCWDSVITSKRSRRRTLPTQGNVLLVDGQVNPEILQHAQQNARVIHVGKRGDYHSALQEFIERLMVLEARAGQCVVCLTAAILICSATAARGKSLCRRKA